jgi:hypothetical protein
MQSEGANARKDIVHAFTNTIDANKLQKSEAIILVLTKYDPLSQFVLSLLSNQINLQNPQQHHIATKKIPNNNNNKFYYSRLCTPLKPTTTTTNPFSRITITTIIATIVPCLRYSSRFC